MKLRLSIILLAAALAAAPAAGQTIKSLGYNTTNGQVVYSGTNTLTFTNTPHFTNTIRLGVFGSGSDRGFVGRNSGGNFALYGTNVTSSQPSFYGFDGTANTAFSAGTSRTNLGLGASNNVVFKELTLNGAGLLVDESGFFSLTVTTNFGGINFVNGTTPMFTLTGSLATFATNVTVNGNLSVGSLTTTTPSTWALDATQTAAATNGRLTLPSNANVIRLTNNNAISSVTNGVLGAFYYIVNQATNAVTISNVGGITIDGAQNLTLSPNESATLVATGATNVSVANRGDLNNVTLTGVDNLATQQTASSGASLMTRGLGDTRYGGPVLLSKLTSDVSYTNNSTGTTILSVTFPSDGAYEVNQLVRFTANGANSKVSLSGSSAGTALTGYRESYNNGSSPTRIVGLKNPVGTGGSFGDTANADNHGRHGVIMAFTGATLQITAAQNTNSTNVTTVGSGSYLSVRQLSADTAW